MFDQLQKLESEGLITLRKHPHKKLWNANYTALCSYNRAWNKLLLQCRGLIVNEDGRVLGRPFKKFFNFSELQGLRNHLWDWHQIKYSELFSLPFTSYEKMDGSLIVLFRDEKGNWEVSSRGSFESDHAGWAREILKEKYSHVLDNLDGRYTYCLELIHPLNRIVVDYKQERDLYILAAIDTINDSELVQEELDNLRLPFPAPRIFHDISGLEQAEKVVEDHSNFEGFVLNFGDGFRCKIKSSEYCAIHRIVSDLTPKRVLEAMKNDVDFNQWLEKVPDEFFQQVSAYRLDFQAKYDIIKKEAENQFLAIPRCSSRRDFASFAKQTKYPALMFKMIDGKPIDQDIWKVIENE